jgi:hypothetical protein
MDMGKAKEIQRLNSGFKWKTHKAKLVDDKCSKCNKRWEYSNREGDYDLMVVACVTCHVGQMGPLEFVEVLNRATAQIKF